MKKTLAATLTTAVLALGTAFPLLAAETHPMPMEGMRGKGQGATTHHGMMGQQGGMMSCPMMGGGMGGSMPGGMMGSRGLPALPPGNAKLQLQMHAEIMQKVGEIVAKYANQVQPR